MHHPIVAITSTVLDELLELLWTEDLGGFRSRILAEGRAENASVRFRLGEAEMSASLAWDAWRNERRVMELFEVMPEGSRRSLDERTALWRVLAALPDLDVATLDRTMRQLDESVRNSALFEGAADLLEDDCERTLEHKKRMIWERLAAWRDRPFHPFARGRGGWAKDEIENYGAEFGRFFALRWCTVSRERLLMSPAMAEKEPIEFILSPFQAKSIDDEMEQRGLAETHVAIPVHPWHLETAVPREFGPELASGEIVVFDFAGPLVCATSSLRTVAISSNPHRHIKLPLDISTLGVRRLMSAQSLHNGLTGAALLEEACSRRPGMAARVQIADETRFCTFHESSGDIFAPRNAFLGCAIREFPIGGEDVVLVPLATFAVAPRAGLPPAISLSLKKRPRTGIETFLEELFRLLIGFAMDALHCGFIPEMHGQNVLIELARGRPVKIVLRDHDTVRCLPEWLGRAGLQTPAYLIKDPRRATMLLDRPESLFAYAQTLLFDVALRSICAAIDRSGHFGLRDSKALLRHVTASEIEKLDAPPETRDRLRTAFLDSRDWPFKQMLTPLLATPHLGLGMPSALGRAANPLMVSGQEQ